MSDLETTRHLLDLVVQHRHFGRPRRSCSPGHYCIGDRVRRLFAAVESLQPLAHDWYSYLTTVRSLWKRGFVVP